MLLSQSLDDLGITRGKCLGRTWWSSPLDWTTYLYYFYKWLYTTSPRSHVLLECSTITWPCHMIWLLKFPCYLYLVSVIWLDVCNQVFECVGNFFLLRALITHAYISALTSSSQLLCHKNFSASLEISLSYQAIYQYLLDNLVSGPSFVPTVIAALHPSNTSSKKGRRNSL